MSTGSSSETTAAKTGIKSGVMQAFISAVTALCLAIVLVGSGLFACCAPFTTEALSNVFSNWQGSPFTHDELVEAAKATRDYTVGSHDRDAILRTLYDINKSAKDAGRATLSGAPDLPDTAGVPSPDELAARFMLANDTYVLTNDALTHLDDVYYVVSTAQVVLIVLAVIALVGCIIIGATGGRRHLGRTIMAASIIVIALFIALAIWVVVDFNSFFAFLHSLFFAEGTWTFSIDSLLIRMYPQEFWIGMGVVWLVTTIAACIICFILGLIIKGRRKHIS